jgi:hypothetical protein
MPREIFALNEFHILESTMDRFLVTAPHTAKECSAVLKQLLYTGYITHFEWGCMDGDHTGWAIIEADNPKEAVMVVPPTQRPSARVVRLKKYSPEEIRSMH